MNLTEKVLTEMLLENTGRALTDSGGAYGRHWERNNQNGIKTGKQICDYWKSKNGDLELYPIAPIFDVLRANFEYNDDCKMLETYITDIDDIDELVREENNIFEELDYWIGSKTAYTYNSDYNICSQDFLLCVFTYDNDDYICISIHNGCDARWGFTTPHIFKLLDIDDFITSTECAFIECECLHNNYRYDYDGVWCYDEEKDIGHNEFGDIVAEKTYIDNQGYLRCKECDGIIMCMSIF